MHAEKWHEYSGLDPEMMADEAIIKVFDWQDLGNQMAWERWRDTKIRRYQMALEAPKIGLGSLENVAADALAAMRQRCAEANFALYRVENAPKSAEAAEEALAALAQSLGLGASENHRSAGDFGIVALRTSSAPAQAGYIPYTSRSLNWHTDGYYNPGDRPVLSFILHCHAQAETGGANQIVDPEIAYLRLREADPRFVTALMHPEAMTIPENREPDGTLRPVSIGPVFFPDPVSGRLQMRYTARTRSIEWRDDPLTREAVDYLAKWLNSDDPLIVQMRLKPGEGVISNNILHNRTAFEDGDATPRVILRVRFHERLKD